jgi:hypothetical protein
VLREAVQQEQGFAVPGFRNVHGETRQFDESMFDAVECWERRLGHGVESAMPISKATWARAMRLPDDRAARVNDRRLTRRSPGQRARPRSWAAQSR